MAGMRKWTGHAKPPVADDVTVTVKFRDGRETTARAGQILWWDAKGPHRPDRQTDQDDYNDVVEWRIGE